jgi:hypothetical protein
MVQLLSQLTNVYPYCPVLTCLCVFSFVIDNGLTLPPLFNVHALGMCAAVGVLLPTALGKLVLQNSTPELKRQNHAIIAYACLGVISLALVGIVANKAAHDKPLLSTSRHALAGWLLSAAFVVQGAAGRAKLHAFTLLGQRVYRWHGNLGAIIAVAAYAVLLSGLMKMTHSAAARSMAVLGAGVPCLMHALLFVLRARARRLSASGYAVVTTQEDPAPAPLPDTTPPPPA